LRDFKILIAICLLLASCSKSKTDVDHFLSDEVILPVEIKNTTVNRNLLSYHRETSVWKYNDQPYSGYAITKYEKGSLKQKFGVFNGKKQNEDIVWFPNGKIKSITNYHKGKLHGEKNVWTENPTYNLVAQFNYYLGKGQGKQMKWYSTGEVYQIIHLNRGREEGLQQAFRKNGVLYANYEAKNGRIFGLKKASLCFALEDQQIKVDD